MKRLEESQMFEGAGSLKEMGEFGLIGRIADLFDSGFENRFKGGIGDDCAVLPADSNHLLLVTTDMLIEGRHFRLDWIGAGDLGYKSLAVNLSDVSAMGGKPEHAFLSIGLPENLSLEWLEKYFLQTHKLCEKYQVSLSGGDTTKSPGPMVINYVVLGRVHKNQILLRSDAKPGDQVALLGKVGESGAGLKLLLENKARKNNRYRKLLNAHNRPPLFVHEAQFVARFSAVHAMIDLSDGIRSDAGHIAEKSSVSIQIDTEKLPVSPELKQVCKEYSWNVLDLALTSGEDYGLFFTIDPNGLDELMQKFEARFGYRFPIIGKVLEGRPEVIFMSNDRQLNITKHGFDHFQSD